MECDWRGLSLEGCRTWAWFFDQVRLIDCPLRYDLAALPIHEKVPQAIVSEPDRWPAKLNQSGYLLLLASAKQGEHYGGRRSLPDMSPVIVVAAVVV